MRRTVRSLGAVACALGFSIGCGPEGTDSGELSRTGLVCPGCVGGETSDFGGIIDYQCEDVPAPFTDEVSQRFRIDEAFARLAEPRVSSFQWQLPEHAPEYRGDTSVELGATLLEAPAYFEPIPLDSAPAGTECPDYVAVPAELSLSLADGSFAESIYARLVFAEDREGWTFESGYRQLAGVAGTLDLGLDPGQPYLGTFTVQVSDGANGQCGKLSISAIPQTGGEERSAAGSWTVGACPE